MTEAERKLLLWCGMMLLRGHSLSTDEVAEIKDLLGELMKKQPVSGIPREAPLEEPAEEA